MDQAHLQGVEAQDGGLLHLGTIGRDFAAPLAEKYERPENPLTRGWVAASRGRPAPWDSKAAYKEPKPSDVTGGVAVVAC